MSWSIYGDERRIGPGPAGVAFNPASLFSGGYTGGWWDPSDLATTWQDTAGTTPANANGQDLKRIDDKSGNGNNILYVSGTSPTLGTSSGLWWLDNSGAQSGLRSTFTHVQPVTRINVIIQNSWASGNVMLSGGVGGFVVFLQANGSPGVSMSAASTPIDSSAMTLATPFVVIEIYNGASSSLQLNNGTPITGSPGTTDPAGITVGSQYNNTTPADASYYSALSIGRLLNSTELANCRTYFGAKAGLVL